MPGFLRRPAFYIVIVVVLLLGGGFFYMKGQAAEKKKKLEAAAAQEEPSPYAAIANGKADVEGGVIQVAARRQGIVREVFVQEGDTVVKGQPLAKQEDDDAAWRPRPPRPTWPRPRPNCRSTRCSCARPSASTSACRAWPPRTSSPPRSWTPPDDQIAQATGQYRRSAAAIGVASAQVAQAKYNQELTVIRAPANGRIARRYANPGAGASTLNVTSMFDLEPNTQRIVRAEIVEADIPNVANGQEVEIQPEERSGQDLPARSCAAPPSSGPASWPPTIPANAATNASSRSWSAPTAPRCWSANACWSSS
jgi:multidrug efflux pump subunit AcrA (membrane-fusion protein)